MLIASKNRYVPTAVNMTVLQGDDGMYYYLHRALYDQCVVLHELYNTNLTGYYKLITDSDVTPANVMTFAAHTPAPLAILAPFLSFVTKSEELTTIEDMCGAISAMSMSVDFHRMLRVPSTVRQSIKFSLSVREEYKIQWDRFFAETPTLDEVSYSKRAVRVDATPIPAERPRATAPSVDDDIVIAPEDVPDGEEADALRELLASLQDGSVFETDEPEAPVQQSAGSTKSGFSMLKGMVQ